jgi:hypothetical protein
LEDIILVSLLREYVLCCSWSHEEGGPGNWLGKRFLGARKLARLLVGWDDSIVSLWTSGKRMLGSIFLLLVRLHCK